MNIRRIFSQIKWFEYAYMSFFMIALVVMGVIFHSNWMIILNSIFSIIAIFFIAKGLVIGNVVGIIQNVFYSIVSYQNNYFGEVLIAWAILIPSYALAIITWMKNRNKKNSVVNINRNLSKKEWCFSLAGWCVLSVVMFFVLRALSTANLYFSWASISLCLMANYMLIRRCEYSFVFFILNNLIGIGLWLGVVLDGDVSNIPTVANYCVYIFLNSSGIVNWIKLKRSQKADSFEIIMSAIKEK